MSKDPRNKIRNPNCTECALHEEAEHVCLMGDGPIPCEVMILGEAPGHREDEEHRAFVGKAGQLLDEVLEEAGLKRKNCYITNVAKCFPSESNTPTKPQIKTCVQEYLWDEIEAVQPAYVLLLGNSALYGITKRSGITKHRGKEYEVPGGARALATYHPAAVLRNPYLDSELRADIHRFGRMVSGEEGQLKTKTILINNSAKLRRLIDALRVAPVVAFDIETTSLKDWKDDSEIVTIGFSWGEGKAAVVPLAHPSVKWRDWRDVLKVLKPVLERKDCKYIAHNGKFDCRWLAQFGVFVPLTFDTMYAAHLLDENRRKGLKLLSQVILGADAYDVGDELQDAQGMPIKRLAIYNAKDCDYTLRLYNKFRPQILEEQRTARLFKGLIMPGARALMRVERGGIQLDPNRLETRTAQAYEVLNKLRRYMLPYLPKHLKPDSFDTDRKYDLINFNSPQQVGDWFFNHLGLPVIEETKTGMPSTKESVLLQLAKQHPAPKALLKYRKWNKYVSTYLHPWTYEHSDELWRMHPNYRIEGTRTGRLSASDPNIQQTPRDPFLRGIIGARPGYSFIEADFSQIEMRIAAMLAEDRRLLRVFHEGGDVHMDMACKLTGKIPADITKEERKKAKSVNFGFLFGMGPKKFVGYALDNYDLEVDIDEATDYRNAFFESWPSLRAWHDRQRRLVQRHGRVHSPFGRIRHLPDVWSGDKEVRAEAERQAINSPVQSCASDLMLLSLLRLDAKLDHRRAFICGTVHDSLLLEVKNKYVDEVSELVVETMEDTGVAKKRFGAEISVPIKVELSVGQHWGEGEVWNEGR